MRLSIATILACFACGAFAQQDPPARVARLNFVSGNVSMQPAGLEDWAPADLNRPLTTGDYLYTDTSARSELHMDVAVMRMDALTSFGFLNLSDQAIQIKLAAGDMYFRLRNFGPNQTFEVDTPNAAVTLLRDGSYRFRVAADGSMSFVVVRQGQAEITGGGQAFTLNPGNSALINASNGSDSLSYDVESAPAPDDFDNWCVQRDQHEARLASARYLPPSVIGYEDLDDNGSWETAGDYGPVWYPRAVVAGWAPYHYGHWVWVEPWGWTWVDDAHWGFAPFHYGRWVYLHERWGWCPGPIAIVANRPPVRPYYAPALVAWFGGAHWGVSVSAGGPSLGWVALGAGEVYTPSYHCSRPYFSNVNVSNTRVVNNVNITNVYNTVYVNKTVYNQTFVNVRAPNAVVAMPHVAFASGRPVRESGMVVSNAQLSHFQPGAATLVAPPVAPTRQAMGPAFVGRPVAHPPVQVAQRQVVARNNPPAAVAPFAARQAYLQQHAGQPHEFQAVRQAAAPPANIRMASAAKPVPTQPGQRGGNAAENAHFSRPTPAQPHTQAPAQAPSNLQPRPPSPAARPAERTQMERTPVQAQEPHPQPPSTLQPHPPSPAARRAERTQMERTPVQAPQIHPEKPPQKPPQEYPHVEERSQQSHQERPPAPAAQKPQPEEHRAPPPKPAEHKDDKDHKER